MVPPMKLMIASEFGSTGAPAMFLFQRLSAGNGTNPFKLAPIPVDMTLQLVCAETTEPRQRTRSTEERNVRIGVTPREIRKASNRRLAPGQPSSTTRMFHPRLDYSVAGTVSIFPALLVRR